MNHPNGCTHCGIEQRDHVQRWKPPIGWHQWTAPTQEQIKERMLARRADHPGSHHIGRAFTGHQPEDDCPCPQEPCGLVDIQNTNPACTQHPPAAAKSMRQAHTTNQCPGADTIAEAGLDY